MSSLQVRTATNLVNASMTFHFRGEDQYTRTCIHAVEFLEGQNYDGHVVLLYAQGEEDLQTIVVIQHTLNGTTKLRAFFLQDLLGDHRMAKTIGGTNVSFGQLAQALGISSPLLVRTIEENAPKNN